MYRGHNDVFSIFKYLTTQWRDACPKSQKRLNAKETNWDCEIHFIYAEFVHRITMQNHVMWGNTSFSLYIQTSFDQTSSLYNLHN